MTAETVKKLGEIRKDTHDINSQNTDYEKLNKVDYGRCPELGNLALRTMVLMQFESYADLFDNSAEVLSEYKQSTPEDVAVLEERARVLTESLGVAKVNLADKSSELDDLYKTTRTLIGDKVYPGSIDTILRESKKGDKHQVASIESELKEVISESTALKSAMEIVSEIEAPNPAVLDDEQVSAIKQMLNYERDGSTAQTVKRESHFLQPSMVNYDPWSFSELAAKNRDNHTRIARFLNQADGTVTFETLFTQLKVYDKKLKSQDNYYSGSKQYQCLSIESGLLSSVKHDLFMQGLDLHCGWHKQPYNVDLLTRVYSVSKRGETNWSRSVKIDHSYYDCEWDEEIELQPKPQPALNT